MANSVVVLDSLIVIPKFDSLVLSTSYEMFSVFSDCKSINLSSLRSIEHSNGLSIKAVPVSNLSVATSSKNLRLIWMIKNLLEHSRFKETHNSGVGNDIPDDAWTIVWRWDSLGISFVYFDIGNSTSVFFEWAFHDLSLPSNSPDSNFTFHTTRDNLLAIRCSWNRCNSVVVSIVDSIEKFSWLRKERSDLTIIPSRKDRFSITGEENAVAFKSWDFDSQKFLSSFCVPDSDIVQGAGGEKLRVAAWESNVINSFIMACVSQLWSNIICVAPINCSFWSSTEEVCWISC